MTSGRTQTLVKVLDKLCALFDCELERQTAVQRMCAAQGTAAHASDLEALDVHTQALVVLMEDALMAEKTRVSLLHWIVDHYSLPEKEHTLTDLIVVVPQPWRGRMRAFQTEIREILAATQEIVTANERFMYRASEKLDDSIQFAVNQVSVKPDGYCAAGREADDHRQPALLNTVG
jgi:hypothetical protein